MNRTISLTIKDRGHVSEYSIPFGANLRDALLARQHSPYQGAFRRLNCQGMGLCGSCKVWVWEAGQKWERRACQIRCFQAMEVELI